MKVPSMDSAPDIEDLIQQVNDQADHVADLTNSVVIIANGSVTLTYDAGTKTYPDQNIQVAAGMNAGFMGYLTRSDQPGKVYSLPYHEILLVPSFSHKIAANMILNNTQLSTNTQIVTTYASPPATITYYYYILQQAVDQTTS